MISAEAGKPCEAEARAVEAAVAAAIDGGVLPADVVAAGTTPASTSRAGDAVRDLLRL